MYLWSKEHRRVVSDRYKHKVLNNLLTYAQAYNRLLHYGWSQEDVNIMLRGVRNGD